MADLLDETLEYMGSVFSSYFHTDEKEILEKIQYGRQEDVIFITEEQLKPYLHFIKDHRNLFFAAIKYPTRFGSGKSFEIMSKKIFNPIMEKFEIPENKRMYILMFYIKGIMGILQIWIMNGCEDSIDFITGLIIEMVMVSFDDREKKGTQNDKIS